MPKPKIFVSHSHKNDDLTDQVVRDLQAAGAQVWVDKADIHDGNWLQRIDEALLANEWLVLIMTPESLASPAVRHEVSVAISRMWKQQMRGVIPIVMAAIQSGDIPPTWDILQRYDAVQEGYLVALAKLCAAVGLTPPARITAPPAPNVAPSSPQPARPPATPTAGSWSAVEQALGKPLPARYAALKFSPGMTRDGHPFILPPLANIPAGPAPLGGDKDAFLSLPAGTVQLAAYQIGVYPVTVAEYGCAVKAGSVREPPKPSYNDVTWQKQLSRLDHPVVNIPWHDAMAYIAWLRQVTGDATWRLPTEAEWEHAARGTDGRFYPWGNTFDQNRANTDGSGENGTTPVGKYAERGDASPYGCHDMAGNVWEWTSTIYRSSAYKNDNNHENFTDTSSNRVLRGGSWGHDPQLARAAFRDWFAPDILDLNWGFRVARGAGGLVLT